MPKTSKAEIEATALTGQCLRCGGRCCQYIALEWERPSCKRDYDYIRWFLLHEHVHVFVDHAGKWHVEFQTPCQSLGSDGRCATYAERPALCREHGEKADESCEFLGEDSPYRVRFSTVREFERYLDKKGVDWRWKRRAPNGA